MAHETELKFELTRGEFEQLLTEHFSENDVRKLEHVSTYFDTEDRSLSRKAVTLRMRRCDGETIQTLKTAGDGSSAITRGEWESPAEGETPVIDETLRDLIGNGIETTELVPLFRIEVTRRLKVVPEGGGTIEIALDEGRAIAQLRQVPICEVEFELKNGRIRDLFRCSNRMLDGIPARIGVLSKSERGYRLVDALRYHESADETVLDAQAAIEAGFRAIASPCLRQFRVNEDLFLLEGNPESLHQARVGLRRLRSALAIFKPVLPQSKRRHFARELRWLAGKLAETRNLDALLATPLGHEHQDALEMHRAKAAKAACDALNSLRARKAIMNFFEWLHCLKHGRMRNNSLERFASVALENLLHKVRKRARHFDTMDAGERHELRKILKKLRYAAAFFRTLFDNDSKKKKYIRFLDRLERLQEILGRMNDEIVRADILFRNNLISVDENERLLAEAARRSRIRKAAKALEKICDQKPFWR